MQLEVVARFALRVDMRHDIGPLTDAGCGRSDPWHLRGLSVLASRLDSDRCAPAMLSSQLPEQRAVSAKMALPSVGHVARLM